MFLYHVLGKMGREAKKQPLWRIMSTLIRSFIAVPLSAQIHQNLDTFTRQSGLISRDLGFKPVNAKIIHLTLKFLGEIDQNMVHAISETLDQVTAKFYPFAASVRGIGAFPGWTNRVRVIWAGMEPADTLRSLYRTIDDATVRLGVPSEGREFFPHLTLVRVAFMTAGSEQVISKLKTLAPQPDFGEFTVDRVVLFKSVLQPQGPVYSVLSSHSFSADKNYAKIHPS